MDMFKVATGLFWFIAGQACFYLFYPVFFQLMSAITSATLGTNALPESLEWINWGGFILAYVSVAWIMPIYYLHEGLTKG